MTAETLSIENLRFDVRRSGRRKTLGLTVDRNGELKLHAPEAASREHLEAWVASRMLWVYQKLALKESSRALPASNRHASGDSIYYLGRSYRIRFVAEQDEPVHCRAGWFELRTSDREQAPALIREWFRTTGGRWLKDRVRLLSSRYGLLPRGVEILDLGNRWGSCSRSRCLNFNWRTLQLPTRLIDYVIVHELVHLAEPYHNAAFWNRLEGLMPDYAARKSELLQATREYVVI